MNKKPFLIILAALLWLSSYFLIFQFTGDTAEESDSLSMELVRYIEGVTAKHFHVNPNDDFWNTTLNSILRKCAHFIEYCYLGATTAFLLYLLFRRKLLPFPISIILCFVVALSDEYRQQFVTGRSGQWSDVLLDVEGAALGIIVFGLLSLVHYRIKRLKDRVRELESVDITRSAIINHTAATDRADT